MTNLREEHVTRKLAICLVSKKYEIISVHPPDGQGPFVIPVDSVESRIERGSIHPDLVAIDVDKFGKKWLTIAECKLLESDLEDDVEKFKILAGNRRYLLYAFFRCQSFLGGPNLGFNYSEISRMKTEDFPLKFMLAASADASKVVQVENIGSFKCHKYLFSSRDLRL